MATPVDFGNATMGGSAIGPSQNYQLPYMKPQGAQNQLQQGMMGQAAQQLQGRFNYGRPARPMPMQPQQTPQQEMQTGLKYPWMNTPQPTANTVQPNPIAPYYGDLVSNSIAPSAQFDYIGAMQKLLPMMRF